STDFLAEFTPPSTGASASTRPRRIWRFTSANSVSGRFVRLPPPSRHPWAVKDAAATKASRAYFLNFTKEAKITPYRVETNQTRSTINQSQTRANTPTRPGAQIIANDML